MYPLLNIVVNSWKLQVIAQLCQGIPNDLLGYLLS